MTSSARAWKRVYTCVCDCTLFDWLGNYVQVSLGLVTGTKLSYKVAGVSKLCHVFFSFKAPPPFPASAQFQSRQQIFLYLICKPSNFVIFVDKKHNVQRTVKAEALHGVKEGWCFPYTKNLPPLRPSPLTSCKLISNTLQGHNHGWKVEGPRFGSQHPGACAPLLAKGRAGCLVREGHPLPPPAVMVWGITPGKFLKIQMLNPAFWWLLAVKFLAFWLNAAKKLGDQYIVGPQPKS